MLLSYVAIVSPPQIVVAVIVPLIALAVYFARRGRRQCPYHNPLCRSSRPCILCYRDLYKSIVPKGGTD